MKNLLYTLAFSFLVFSCVSVEESNDKPDNYNRQQMLSYWTDQIIIPAYADFTNETAKLEETTNNFVSSPDVENLTKLKAAWESSYVSWQKASLFQVGKAQELNMTGAMNTYPTNVNGIKKYIEEANYNFDSPNTLDEQGFPALDYLLFGLGSEEETINIFKNDPKYANYLKDVSVRINKLSNQVYNDWKTSYSSIFISEDGYSTTSSVDKMVNFYAIAFYEKQLREPKIVTPAGIRTGEPIPSAVEAYYSKTLSKKLYVTALKATSDFFRGVSYDGTTKGQSLKQYLEFLKRKDLSNLIDTNFDKIEQLNSTLEDNFAAQVADPVKIRKMRDVYDALQVVLKNFKPNMFSAMSVMNSSTDSDND